MKQVQITIGKDTNHFLNLYRLTFWYQARFGKQLMTIEFDANNDKTAIVKANKELAKEERVEEIRLYYIGRLLAKNETNK